LRVATVPVEGRRGLLGPAIRKRKAPVVDMKLELVPVPGSACSIRFGTGVVDRGRAVDDPEQAEVPTDRPPVSYAFFKDPDGNSWVLQQLRYLVGNADGVIRWSRQGCP
jgi:hypothetical protein